MVPATYQALFQVPASLNLQQAHVGGTIYYPHFTDGDREAQRGAVISPGHTASKCWWQS